MPLRLVTLWTAAALLAACASAPGGGVQSGPMIPPTADDPRRAAPWHPMPDSGQATREASRAPVDIAPALRAARRATDAGLEAGADRAIGWWRPLPEQPPWSEILSDDRTVPGSLAVGTVTEGKLKRARRLPLDGPHYSVIERHRRRHTNWGTDEMVALLEEVAADVADAHPGSTLRIGNIGYKHGGNIPWSVSHNTGRDADLAFFAQKADDGTPVPSPDLVEYDADGRATGPYTDLVFDVERNWTLVRSLLTASDTDVLWMFISEPLKEKLLAHARQSGASDKLIERAAKVLHQPTSAPPHADHLHLRIACSRQDRVEACVDWGPRWPWVDFHHRALLARSLELGEALEAADPETRSAALETLHAIHSPYAPEIALRHARRETDPDLRERALEIGADIPAWSVVAVDAARQLLEDHSLTIDAKRRVYEVLRRSRDRMARRIALDRLFDDTLPAAERRLAARALLHTMEPGLVPVLIEELKRQPVQVRAELARVLRRITLFSTDIDWENADRQAVDAGVETWREWWAKNRHRERDAWIRRALSDFGVRAVDLDALTSVDRLIPLLRKAPDFIAYNINRQIHRLTDRWVPLEAWTYRRLHDYWSKWWQANRDRLLSAEDGNREASTASN